MCSISTTHRSWVNDVNLTPLRYWVDTFSTTTYIINQLPMPVPGGLLPLEVLFGKSTNYENFHPFGYRV